MRWIGIATLVVCTITALPARSLWAATSRGGIISQSTALKHGLVRDWYAHVEIDGARDRVVHTVVDRDSIFFQSELGLVENVDAATGRQLWIREIGRRIDPVLPLRATDAWVAVISGPRLYLLDRASGHVEFVRRFDGVASTGPSVSAFRVYVPLMQGPLESFQLPTGDDAAKTAGGQLPHRTFPWRHFSSGRTVGGLLVTSQAIAWTTDRGYLYISELDSRQPLYRVETGDVIVVPLAHREPLIYGASLGGFVYAVDETTGIVAWRVSLGSPIRVAPAMVGDRLYVCPDRRGMYCLDAGQGGELWWAPRATRFVAASPTRVYASDAAHRLLILDAQTGARLGMLPTQNLSLAVRNVATDRIFLGTPSGSIQCLHEIELTEPVRHWKKTAEKQPDAADKEPESGETTAAADDTPAAEEAEPEQRDPFGGEDQDPFGGDDRDPFGDE